jgi:uncharacterized membrane protein
MIAYLQKSAILRKLYFDRSDMDRILLLSCLFSIMLSAARIVYTGSLMFVFLSWNLFLACLPLLITRFITTHISWIENKIKFWIAFISWLLLIPNSFYIITDLFHLRNLEVMPLWFDLALILSFAWNGLLIGILSLRQMEKIITVQFRLKNNFIFVYPVMWLNAFGIYIGRYLRFNSWDVVTNPFALVSDIVTMILHPVLYRFEWSMVICFSILMMLIYSSLKQLSKAVW